MHRIQKSRPCWAAALTVSLLSLAISGCTASSQDGMAEAMTACPEQRPQICTREYNPVCATLVDQSTATYATGCTACADANVIGWLAGACPETP